MPTPLTVNSGKKKKSVVLNPVMPQSSGVAVRTMKTLPFLQEKYLCSSMLWNRSVHSRGDPSATSFAMLFQTLRIINSYRIY